MAVSYRAKGGDTIDLICWQHYGRQRGAVEEVLKANPGLSPSPVLEAGTLVYLPDLGAEADAEDRVRMPWEG